MFNFINNIIKKIIFLNLKIYKLFFSSLLGVNCRYTPTCSEYFHDAVKNGLEVSVEDLKKLCKHMH